jgi:hypothetical protein
MLHEVDLSSNRRLARGKKSLATARNLQDFRKALPAGKTAAGKRTMVQNIESPVNHCSIG